jgi:hypothetical protein
LFAKTADLGKEPGEVSLDILYVWQKTKNGWKLLARQAVKVEKRNKKLLIIKMKIRLTADFLISIFFFNSFCINPNSFRFARQQRYFPARLVR